MLFPFSSFPVEDDDQVVMMSDRGRIIRMPVDDIRTASRNTQGVILFNTEAGEKVASVAHLAAGAAEASEPDALDSPATKPDNTEDHGQES